MDSEPPNDFREGDDGQTHYVGDGCDPPHPPDDDEPAEPLIWGYDGHLPDAHNAAARAVDGWSHIPEYHA